MILSLDRISFAYPEGPTIFEAVSLNIEPASYTLVQGPSGSGKSTLLRLLCRMEDPLDGRILLNDTPISEMSPPELRRTVAYVQQLPTLLKRSVRDNLLLAFEFDANKGLKPPTDTDIQAFLDTFLLKDITPDTPADTLSVGQSQRICLIRSLLLRPRVMLMDEPTASLDADSASVVLDKTAKLVQGGMTVIMISHSETVPPGVTNTIRISDQGLEVQ